MDDVNALHIIHLTVPAFRGGVMQDRERSKNKLMEDLLQFEMLLDAVSMIVFIKDTRHNFIKVNQALCDAVGMQREELEGRNVVDIFPSNADEFIQADREVMRSQQPIKGLISQLETVQGKKWFQIDKVPYFGSNGELRGVIDSAFDITVRKHAEDELRISEQKYAHAEKIGNFGHWQRDYIQHESTHSVGAYKIFGIDAAKFDSKSESFLDRIHPDDRKILIAKAQNAYANQSTLNAEYRITNRSDGSERVIEAIGEVYNDEQGQPRGMIGTYLDITERRRMEEELRKSQEQYVALAEASPVGIFRTDADGNCSYVNQFWCQISGLTAAQAMGDGWQRALHPDDRQRVFGQWQTAVEKGAPFQSEYRFRTPEGVTTWLFGQSRIERDSDGRIIAYVGTVTDITERKRMAEELQKMEKLESISVLAGGIGHDLNNLLTSIVGNLALARLEEDAGQKDDWLAEAEKASMRVKDLSQQLLAFSQGGPPILQKADIGALLKESVTFSLRGSHVSSDFSIADGLWTVGIDEGQINQVISNLIINAQQAMLAGGKVNVSAENILIEKHTRLPLKAGPYVKISVEDHGVGIPEQYLNRIFDPFFSTKENGSGLGLANSYAIVQKHNGYMAVESKVGVGTRFDLYIPATAEASEIRESQDALLPIHGQGTILLMDDEESIRDIAVKIMSSLGYQVVTCSNGEEAIVIVEQVVGRGESFDAVILDVTVAGGMGAMATMRQLADIAPDVKVIVSTGYINNPIMSEYKDYGFRGVIAKPYKIREMSEVLQDVLATSD